MKQRFPSLAGAYRRRRSHQSALLLALVASAFALPVSAQAPAAPVAATAAPAANAMDDLVGRIALYPDDLVAVILPASTSPLQIVQADRWLEKRKSDPKLAIDDKWDDAVKTLLNYPEVVKMMSNDLDWTSALGEAVVADQGAVMDGVQSFRRRAQAAGNLKSDDKQVVKAEKEIIIIEPANPRGDLRAAIHAEHGGHLRRGAGLRLLPGPLSVVLLPLPTRRRPCHGRDLGCGHRCGLGRRPLGRRLQRRRHQHRRRPQHQHRPWRPQHQRRPWQWFAPADCTQRRQRWQHLEVQQAAGTGQQFRRQVAVCRAPRGRARWCGFGRLRFGGRWRCPAVRAAWGWRGRRGRAPLGAARWRCSGWRRGPALDPALRRWRGQCRGLPSGDTTLGRLRRQQRQPRRRCLRWLQLGAAGADGQLAGRVEPQLDVRRRGRSAPSGGARGGGGGRGGGGRR